MKKTTFAIIQALILILLVHSLSDRLIAKTDKYRISWGEDPAHEATIGWNQMGKKSAELFIGTTDEQKNHLKYPTKLQATVKREYKDMHNHFVKLKKLKPDTAYFFIIKDADSTSRRFWFRTAPNVAKPFTFIAGGDSRNNRKAFQNGCKLVAKLRPLFILFGGDYTASSRADQWKNWLDDWQLTISSDGRIYPIIPSHGNHEKKTVVYEMFDTPRKESFFKTSIGNGMIDFWTLNSEIKGPVFAEQKKWFEKSIKKSQAHWKIAAYHKPMRPHTRSKKEGEAMYDNFANTFYNNGLDLAIESDTHMVKQTYPIKPSSKAGNDEGFVTDKKGTVFIGEGSWGAPKRPANDNKSWTMASDSFYQFKWIIATPKEMLIRTVKFDNVDNVVPATEKNLMKPPKNIKFWQPKTGEVLRLPFDKNHPTYKAVTEKKTRKIG